MKKTIILENNYYIANTINRFPRGYVFNYEDFSVKVKKMKL